MIFWFVWGDLVLCFKFWLVLEVNNGFFWVLFGVSFWGFNLVKGLGRVIGGVGGG